MEVYTTSARGLRGVDCVIERDNIPLVAVLLVVVLVGATVLDRQTTPESISGQPKILSVAGKIDPYDVSIQGSIVDNYANLSYRMMYDNYASTEAKEVDWYLGLDDELRLSNISVLLDSVVYWGRVFPEQQAVQIYNPSAFFLDIMRPAP